MRDWTDRHSLTTAEQTRPREGERRVVEMQTKTLIRVHGAALVALAAAALAACGSQAYSSFLAEQRNRCYSVPKENYDACMSEAKERYEAYKREQQNNTNEND